MKPRILAVTASLFLLTLGSSLAFAANDKDKNSDANGNGNANGLVKPQEVAAAPEIALASGAGAIALLVGGLLVVRGRRQQV